MYIHILVYHLKFLGQCFRVGPLWDQRICGPYVQYEPLD